MGEIIDKFLTSIKRFLNINYLHVLYLIIQNENCWLTIVLSALLWTELIIMLKKLIMLSFKVVTKAPIRCLTDAQMETVVAHLIKTACCSEFNKTTINMVWIFCSFTMQMKLQCVQLGYLVIWCCTCVCVALYLNDHLKK